LDGELSILIYGVHVCVLSGPHESERINDVKKPTKAVQACDALVRD
jgi:hypothetical protein